MADEIKIGEAPFNNAVNTLMKISDIIDKITKVSTEYLLYSNIEGIRLSAGQAQHIKLRLLRMLRLRAAPLLSPDGRVKMTKQINDVKLKTKTAYNRTGNNAATEEEYDPAIDLVMDDIVFDCVTDLQDKGKYFMPPRDDPRRAVLKH